MDCERAIQENVVERYLGGKLDPMLKQEWEQHYFACEECATRLETWQAIEKPLREMAPEIRREMKPPAAAGRWLWMGAAAAAVVLIAAGVLLRTPEHAPVAAPPVASYAADLTVLARLDPPAYTRPSMRGIETPAERQFRSAMSAYQQRDWAGAIAGLKSALELDPAAPAPRFFLGACYLLNGNPREGVAELERVAAADSPFAEEARFDLVKGYLALDRTDDALALLRKLALTRSEFAVPATALMNRIQGAR